MVGRVAESGPLYSWSWFDLDENERRGSKKPQDPRGYLRNSTKRQLSISCFYVVYTYILLRPLIYVQTGAALGAVCDLPVIEDRVFRLQLFVCSRSLQTLDLSLDPAVNLASVAAGSKFQSLDLEHLRGLIGPALHVGQSLAEFPGALEVESSQGVWADC